MATQARARSPIAVLDAILLVALSILALYLTVKAGQRGFYPFDQSIVFDGAYRLLQGQIPYKDFVLPFGPAAFWVQAFFFRILGVDYSAYLAGSACTNLLAVLCSVAVVRLALPDSRWLSYSAGLLTAVWFYPPFGTPWVDQTAFFFGLVAVLAVLSGLRAGREHHPRAWLWYVVTGCCGFLSIISKQNVGVFLLPLYPLLLVVGHLDRRRYMPRVLAHFALGFCAALIAFGIWLYVESDPASFVHYVLVIPSGLGRERLDALVHAWMGLVRPFFGGRGPLVVNLILLGSLGVSLVALIRRQAVTAVAGVLCIYCVLFEYLFINTTLNQPENGLAYIGIILALGVGTGYRLWPLVGRRALRLSLVAGIMVIVALATRAGVKVSMERKVQDIFRGATFPRRVAIAGLKDLRWAKPMRMGGFEVSEQSLVRLYSYLRQKGQNFFIFPDFTILYGLAGVPSPQPLLWFHEGVTYSRRANADLDRRIVADLRRNDVAVFVLEQVSWFNTGDRLSHFPETKAYVTTAFKKVGEIGTFSIYERIE
jgi:hypothetical protein